MQHSPKRSMHTTGLPTVSFVVCTFNSGALIHFCLDSIQKLTYPKELIEIIVVDGGSSDTTLQIVHQYPCTVIREHIGTPEAATAIGYQAAKNDLIVNFPSDNVIPSEDWLHHMIEPFLEDPEIIGSYTLRYEYRKDDTALNRYFALFASGDPIAYYMHKRDRATYFEKGWPFEPPVQDHGMYYTVRFNAHNLPTIGANGFLLRKQFAHLISTDPHRFFHIDSILDLVAMGHSKFAVVKNTIWHRTGESLMRFFQKRRRWIRIYFQDTTIRRYHVCDMQADRVNLAKCIFYSLTIVQPICESIRGYMKVRDIAWFLHPPISFLCVVIYSYTVITIWLKQKRGHITSSSTYA